MDWHRAKTILIIAFIFLDLFLGFQLYTTMQAKSQYMNKNEQMPEQAFQTQLRQKQIKLGKPLPSDPAQINVFKAKVSNLPSWQKGERGSYVKTYSKPIYVKDESSLNKLLSTIVPHFSDYRYSKSDSKPNERVYLQTKEDLQIFNGRLVVQLEKNKLKAIELSHYTFTQSLDELPINSAQSSLLSLIESEKISKKIIHEVSLGYWAYPTAEEETILPVWRIYIGDTYYLVPANKASSQNIEKIKK
ncbi:two-component system regulatory protein YycI [Thermoflavimicrobium daqui]|uniref:Regulatory protein YycH-like domain-containing protein n=1 Tax=Thermoflavimicrobium daqui TaxID=2137476 RepID=A0A364K3G7_9BACL|nr:two-component system regulatory protein YycI [Thermoflavimicrobium daqui]RAL23380.1 hypothetical protein DL897_11875 [Thermoflavimicrobium daqui]